MKTYIWQPLNQWEWEHGGDQFYTATKRVETWLSVETVRYVLAEQIDIGNGVTRWKAIKKDDVTPKILRIAGKL